MQHIDLSLSKWSQLSLVEQMANIGSEIVRSLKWRGNQNFEYAKMANERALELFDLTLDDRRHVAGVREIARARELWLDFFVGNNQYHQTENQWQKYFLEFNMAASKNRANGDLRNKS